MSGIFFLSTRNLLSMVEFYKERIGMDVWLEQADCIIFQHGNLLLGFCKRDHADTDGMITFFFDTNDKVDQFYNKFKESSVGPPKTNKKYGIYHFFCKDPEGRDVEFQRFLTSPSSPC